MNEILDDFMAEKTLLSHEKYLYDGRIMTFYTNRLLISIGTRTTIEGKKPKDGLYRLLDENIRFELKNGKVIHEYYIDNYSQSDNQIIEIDGSRVYGIRKGSKVYINNKPAPDGIYKMGWWSRILVKNGVIV